MNDISYILKIFLSRYNWTTAGFYKEVCNEIEKLIKENRELKKVIHNIQNEKFPTVFTFEELNNKWEVKNVRSNNTK